MNLTEHQTQILLAVFDTFYPSVERAEELENRDFWTIKASDYNILPTLRKVLSQLPLDTQTELLQLLQLLDSKKLGLTWLSNPKPFLALSSTNRTKLIQAWATSPISQLRKAFNALKKITGLIYFGHLDEKGQNPFWKNIDYQIPAVSPPKPSSLNIKYFDRNEILSADVVVIGSGAGGGVVAAQLAESGYNVIVLEKGLYVHEEIMNYKEIEMLQKTYEEGGAATSIDGAVTLLAGNCVGGGTTVNWSASLRTPDWILEEWATKHGNPHFTTAHYKSFFDKIEKRTSINTELSIHNPQNNALLRGASTLGYSTKTIPRNVIPPSQSLDSETYWKLQGFGGLGDKTGSKQGTMNTFLVDACEKDTIVVPRAEAHTILHAQRKVTGVIAYQKTDKDTMIKLTISCKKVVVCAGAIHTPAILLRSGLRHPEIGNHLFLHPTNAVSAIYDESMKPWEGPMMSGLCDEFVHLDENYGYLLETPPMHPAFIGMAMPWLNGEQYKEDMLGIKDLGTFIILTRDRFGGRVKINSQGKAKVHYRLSRYDRSHLIHGMKEAVKIHVAAGAKVIRMLHNEREFYDTRQETLQSYLRRFDKLSWSSNRFSLYSAHQMGTCRMGGDKMTHPLKPTGESREVKNLFVADASAFPECSGVNPMLSIQALACHVAEAMLE